MGENDIQSDNPFNSCYASFCKDRRRGDLGVTPLPFCQTLSTPERPVKFGVLVIALKLSFCQGRQTPKRYRDC